MLLSFATVTITVLRPATILDHGQEVPDYTDLTPHTEAGCIVQPAGFSEDPVENDLTTTQRLVQAPPSADVRRLDLVELPAETGRWRVEGEPAPWPSPTGGLSHLSIVVSRNTEGV